MRHRFHGDPERFEVVADLVAQRFGRRVTYVADVAGGQGMLARVLTKRYGYRAEVVDPRTWRLRGVSGQSAEFSADLADYYDLIVGLHPDDATRAVAEAALRKPSVLVPCCNFWDAHQRLGRDALLDAIAEYYDQHHVEYERVELAFRGPMNVALVSAPRVAKAAPHRLRSTP